ncbi:hypothetical protein P5673_030286 [Acropora cervicornis]|uniref:Uncharacterized protein n=1 Tax=Acropora cervicornis TaxID=6130 RepID=A0AAD9PV96_ACRCE|nr:hypothetical protein P5673_030286 [Acropora cervicornis]
MATYGKIGEFKESEESWTHYIERLEQYFLANEVDEVGKKRAILLSVCGSKTYTLARDLLQPVRPAEATFKKIAGQTNGNADGLSRLPLPVMPDSVPLPGETILLMEHLEGTPVHSGHIKAWTKRDPVLSQCKQKAVHDYHAKERTLEEGQAVHAKNFRYKKTWLPGTLVEKTGPVLARIQLDDGTVIRRHQDHVRVPESAAAAASITSEIPEATPVAISEPVAIFEPDASSANTNSREYHQ